MKQLVIGIFAHVDAGKTTLSEALLYCTGQLRRLGRVDHRDAFLDTDALERERGITIFAKQAVLEAGGVRAVLLDTPGHVDFAGEAERTLDVLDCAVLVLDGTAGVQSHTETLWQLLEPMLCGSILVAHNAPFDLRVLASCLHDYHIDWQPEAAYLCTCQMGKRAYPYLPNHKLNTLCDHLQLSLDHHKAGSDSRACALLLLNYLEKGLQPEAFLRTYRFADRKTIPYCGCR